MDQDNERLLDPDSNPDLEWWSDLASPSNNDAHPQPTPTPTSESEPAADLSPTITDKAAAATTPDKPTSTPAPTPAPMPTPNPTDTPDKAASAATASDAPTQNSKSDPPQENSQLPKSAVIDRFEGKWAVLLVGEDEQVLNVPRTSLPKRVRAGHWLKIQQSEDDPENLLSAEIDSEATAVARARIADKLAKLRSGNY